MKVRLAETEAQAKATVAAKTAEATDLASKLAESNHQVEGIKAQNLLLQKQMHALDDQIERARNASLDITRDTPPDNFSVNSTSSSSSAENDNDGPAAELSRLKAMLKYHMERHSVVQVKLDLQVKHSDDLQRRIRSLEESLEEANTQLASIQVMALHECCRVLYCCLCVHD